MTLFDRHTLPQLFAFDLDGVVADTELLHSEAKLRLLSRRFGVAERVEVERYVGLPNTAFWSDMMRRFPGQVTGDVAELSVAQLDTILELLAEQKFRPSAGLLPLLERLSALGVKRALFSSSDRFYVDAVLRFFDIARFFPVILGGDDVPRRKPHPDGYEKAVELSNADASRSVAVEDSTAGVASAQAAGLRVIGYRNPTSGGQDVSRADRVVDSLEEILPMLGE